MEYDRSGITFRTATINDSELLYRWVNDEGVRKNSFTSDKIEYETHKLWLSNKLNCTSTTILIVEDKDVPVGQIRIDIEDNEPYIDISVTKEKRGLGLGTEILRQIGYYLLTSSFPFRTLNGIVKIENTASQKAFVAAGFNEISRDTKIVKYKKKI